MSETDDLPTFGVAATLTSGERPLATGIGWSGSTLDDEADDLVGQTLCNTYVIERILGEGGMGRVYLAHHTRIQRKRLAVKVLHPEYLRKPDILRRFQREAEAAASIVSEHVVRVYDVDLTADGRPFIVAELLDGIELGDLLDRERRLAIPYAVRIVRQICEAMTAAHAQGVVHRDMKPENVFLTGDMDHPQVKVLDFGISRLEDEGTKLTKVGTVMGTPAYMPPEQARGEHVDHRADVYSVGAILYRALTGQPPFDRDDPMATMAAVFTEEPPRPRSFDPAIPEHLEAIVQRAMAKQREQRHASMAELSAALEPYDTALGPTGHGVASVAQSRSAREARSLLVSLLAAAVIALLALVVSAGVASLRLFRGAGPSGVELAIALGCLLLGAATPAVLGIRQLRRTTWSNSARVLDAVETVKRPLVAGAAIYGGSWLFVALLDVLTLSSRSAWPGWWVLFAATGLLAAVTAHFASRPALSGLGRSPMVSTAAALAAIGGVVLFGWAIHDPGNIPLAAAEDGTTSSAGASSDDDEPIDRASEDDLAAAKKKGIAGLETLAAAHPKDPAVLKALLLAQADKTTTLDSAMATAKKLAASDLEAMEEREVVAAIVEGANWVKSREAALDLMATSMGEKGIDLLWDLAHGATSAKDGAKERLADSKVRARGSAALRVAYDLEAAEGCAGKAALLERATDEGDARAVAVLRPLVQGTGRGCGLLGLGACPAPCHGEAARMKAAIAEIESR